MRTLFILLIIFCGPAFADVYQVDDVEAVQVIGELRSVHARYEDTLLDIARENGIGHDEIIQANPNLNRWLPGEDARVLLPTRYVLPDAPHSGIVINLAELRLYYFEQPAKRGLPNLVHTYPISIGRLDWKTPLGRTSIARKDTNPPWHPTPAIREEHARDGDPLPAFIPGGVPENPLGRYALRLGIPRYLIHGTDERKVYGIGMRVTHGCIRMYPEHIERLFQKVRLGTPVQIVDQPMKLGVRDGRIYLEVHSFLEEDVNDQPLSAEEVANFLARKIPDQAIVDREAIKRTLHSKNGVPEIIGSLPEPEAFSKAPAEYF